MNDIKRQIKDEYYLEDNYLISEKEEIIDDRYSLSKTVEELMGKGYGCR
ncbi:MAG: hypothetical protein Q4D13_08970 [Erysipelotrichaceae bacterium]|nr:hypothetical protein [Erysipelotrichaceae bacterium]